MISSCKSATCVAPINIAVIKYWGKENEELNIPLNSSLSVTLDADDLCAKTTVTTSQDYEEDSMTLDGRTENIKENERLQRCLNKVREPSSHKCIIESSNNFPTAAGLASSAAGYACLAKCLGAVYDYKEDLSIVARLGSGSACRSMYGGFVKWTKGTCANGTDSKAKQIADVNHWPGLKVIILVVSSTEKSVGSTKGMKRSVETSELLKPREGAAWQKVRSGVEFARQQLQSPFEFCCGIDSCQVGRKITSENNYRAEVIVPKRMEVMEKAILERNFETFAEITMKESNQLHAICQDSYPTINPPYMNSTSHQIVDFVTKYNTDEVKVAYTFDAGANAVLFTLEDNFGQLVGTILKYFPCPFNMINLDYHQILKHHFEGIDIMGMSVKQKAIQRIICTKPGEGARLCTG